MKSNAWRPSIIGQRCFKFFPILPMSTENGVIVKIISTLIFYLKVGEGESAKRVAFAVRCDQCCQSIQTKIQINPRCKKNSTAVRSSSRPENDGKIEGSAETIRDERFQVKSPSGGELEEGFGE